MTFLIGLSLAAGILGGYFFGSGSYDPGFVTEVALGVMLFGVGLDLGQNRDAWKRLKEMGIKVLAVPAGAVVGSALGAFIVGGLWGEALNYSLCMGGGYGWYSISGILVERFLGVEAGAVAFLNDFFRELISLLTLPFWVKVFGGRAAASVPGATAMDTSLPVLHRSAGGETAMVGFVSGAVLTALVPLILPFFASF